MATITTTSGYTLLIFFSSFLLLDWQQQRLIVPKLKFIAIIMSGYINYVSLLAWRFVFFFRGTGWPLGWSLPPIGE